MTPSKNEKKSFLGSESPGKMAGFHSLDDKTDVVFRRMETLYEISKYLVFLKGVDAGFVEILNLVASVFPLSSAAMIEKKELSFKTRIWPNSGLDQPKTKAAIENLEGAYKYLLNLTPAEFADLKAGVVTTTFLRGEQIMDQGLAEGSLLTYLVFPLVVDRQPIFGAIQFVAFGTIDEQDVKFISTLSNLVALAINHVRKAELERLEFLNGVLDNLEDGIVACNSDGIITTFNEAAVKFYGAIHEGATLEEWGSSFECFQADGLTPLKPEELPLSRALHEGGVRFLEIVLKPKNLPLRTLLCHGQTIYDKENRKIGAVASYHDITPQKNADQLADVADELARSNIELKSFSSTAAHDLNAPLNSISQFTELLATDSDSQMGPDSKEYMTFIVNATDRMRKLISRLLEYAQVGAQKEEPKPVDCNAVVDEVLSNLHAAITDSNPTITKNTLPTVLGNRGEISQLFQNLISNALKFRAKDRDPVINIKAHDQEDEQVLFSIVDNGIGIAPKFAATVFDPFKKLHGSSEFEGTGLGLAIARKIVESHGGKIWLESEPGKGTTMFFTLRKGYGEVTPLH